MEVNLPVTPAQRKVIVYIEENLGISFEGYTMHEARQWISTHMEESKKVTQERRDMEDELDNIAYEGMFL